MNTTIAPARTVFAVGIMALGLQNLLIGNFMPELQPVPAWVPAQLAYAVGIIVVGAGAFLAAGRFSRRAALVLALMLLGCVLVLHLPRIVANPSNGGAWTGALEVFAMAAAACVLAAMSPRTSQHKWNDSVDRLTVIGRICFGLTLPGFGILHFVYRDYVASVIPAWIPAHMFWAYATGIAHVAAGLSIVIDVKARLAATLLTIMFGTWAVILHIPRVAPTPQIRGEWTSLFVAITLCGAAWLIRESLVQSKRDTAAAPGVSHARASS